MELSQIRYFLTLCRELNFTKAAALCHVSQPFLQANAPAAIAPLVYVRWIAHDPSFQFFRYVFRAAASSRGPPALS